MATEDGLMMTLHPGVRRHHHRPSCEAFGGDTGHDNPLQGEFTDDAAATITFTEAADRRGPDDGADHADPQLVDDVVPSVADRARGLGTR